MSRSSAILIVGAVSAALVVAPVVAADASPTASAPARPRAADSATASGRHFWTLREADVTAGSPGNYLVITYTAGRALSDGTIRIALPGDQWRTPLSATTLVTETAAGAVAVRPWSDDLLRLPEPGVDPAVACSPVAGNPVPWTVRTVLGSQVIVVRHVNCAPGQKLFVHIKGVAAPSRIGRYYLPIVASDPSGLPRLSVASVEVVPTPQVRLRVTMPPIVPTGSGVFAEVEAVRPDGSPATDYTGAVALVTDPTDCTFSPPQTAPFQFTVADAGVALVPVSFRNAVVYRLRAYDIANKALAGVSAPFEVVGSDPPTSCPAPASYH
jgi:hypothetical protein